MNKKNKEGYTLFHIACEKNRINIIEYLINNNRFNICESIVLHKKCLNLILLNLIPIPIKSITKSTCVKVYYKKHLFLKVLN